MKKRIFAAAVGNDGTRPVVWGIGDGEDFDSARDDAREGASIWLEEAGDPSQDLTVVEIDEETYFRIDAGDVDASGLV